MKGLEPHLPFPSQFTLRIYPALLQGFGADQVYTQEIPFVQYLHLPDSWHKSFLYRFYFTDECRESHCFFLLPGWWGQHQGQSNQPVCKRGSLTLRYELVILWPHLPSELQLSCHLQQRGQEQAWELGLFLKTVSQLLITRDNYKFLVHMSKRLLECVCDRYLLFRDPWSQAVLTRREQEVLRFDT